jgi:hypothetical protein
MLPLIGDLRQSEADSVRPHRSTPMPSRDLVVNRLHNLKDNAR